MSGLAAMIFILSPPSPLFVAGFSRRPQRCDIAQWLALLGSARPHGLHPLGRFTQRSSSRSNLWR